MISWLIHKLSDLIGYEDTKAVMQRPRPVNGAYDYDKAKAGYYRAKARTETGRLLAKPKKSTAASKVVQMPVHKITSGKRGV